MSGIKTKIRRVEYRLKYDFLAVENIVLLLSVVLCLMWTYQSIEAMSRNWRLSEKITAARKELELVSVEVEAAELENAYYETDEYQELMARKLLDKEWPGEKMVVMPENSEEAKNKHKTVAEEKSEEKEYSNFEKWMMFLFPNY